MFSRIRIKPKEELTTKQYTLNEIFHKLVTLKSLQNIRNKDLEKDTTKKIKGKITHEDTIELSKILKEEEDTKAEERKLSQGDIKIHNKIEKSSKPNHVFRRRLALDANMATVKDFHKEDEDKSYQNVKYHKDSTYMLEKKPNEPIYSHLQE